MTTKALAKQSAPRLKRGAIVTMKDRWSGTTFSDDGNTIVVIRVGERPNDWLRGYRAIGGELAAQARRSAVVEWGVSKADRYLRRLRLESEWQGTPFH